MRIAPPDIIIHLQYKELTNVLEYINKCNIHAFLPSIGYTRFEPYREALLEYNVQSMFDKVFALIVKYAISQPKKIKFKLTHGERITLSVMFKRVEVPPSIIHLQTIVINQLTLKMPQNG